VKVRNTPGDFPESIRQTAKEENVALIDLTAMSVAFYERLGPEKSWEAFSGAKDPTHHSALGLMSWLSALLRVRGRRIWIW
jgi:hypothetical protein